MNKPSSLRFHALIVVCSLILLAGCASGPFAGKNSPAAMRKALTFHASFDNGPDADFATGDRHLYTASSQNNRSAAQRGFGTNNVTRIAKGRGRFGDALQFTRKQAPLTFFQAAGNVAYRPTNWSGTVSFWLSVDPVGELENGFCDPIQITPRAWNDAAFFVEFEKRQTIPFRLGVYADYKVWNPSNRKWEDITAAERPLVTVPQPPFAGGKWTHVAFTFENFNTGRDDGVAKLYLDGVFHGLLSPRRQTFTWDETKSAVMLGLSYIGLFDELSVFNRAMDEQQIRALFELREGVSSLLR